MPAAEATEKRALTAKSVTLANLFLQAIDFLVLFLSLDFFWGKESGLFEKSLIISSLSFSICCLFAEANASSNAEGSRRAGHPSTTASNLALKSECPIRASASFRSWVKTACEILFNLINTRAFDSGSAKAMASLALRAADSVMIEMHSF